MHRDSTSSRYRALAGLWALCIGLRVANANVERLPQYARDAWDTSRGYPGGRIFGLTQTSDGYLWIGTDRGLVRFDGLSFRVFSDIGQAHTTIESVFALAADRRGNLLISTVLGIQRLHLRNEELEELPSQPGQPSDPVSGIYPEHDGTILIATVRRGMIAYDGTTFTPLEGTRSGVAAAARARDGALWMGTPTQGLFGSFDHRPLDPSRNLYHVRIGVLLPFREHGLWVGTDKGLLQWDGTNTPGSPFGPAHIQAMLEGRDGILWLGSAEGLCQLGSNGASTAAIPYSRDIVTSLYEDREGDVWAGTSTGIVRLRRRILTTYVLDPDGKERGGPLFADSRGMVWCAKPDRGIIRIVDGRIESVSEAGEYTSLASAGTSLWLGQQDGTLVRATITASTASISLKERRHLGHPIIAISPSREGTIWIGMQNSGVAEINGGHTTFQSNADGFELNTVTAIEQGRDGTMWFATANGVASYSQGRWHSYTAQNGVPPGRINCLFAAETGELWVGADQGLAFIVNGVAHAPASNPPLFRESIFGIAADRDDFLWIRTSSQILRIRRAELVSSSGNSISVRQFGIDDGLPTVAPIRTSRSLTADSEGRIWMALGNTLAMADPSEFLHASPPTPIQIQGVEADEHPISLSDNVLVPAGHRRTVIRFAGLNLSTPDSVRYRYRLSEFDRDWGEPTSVREATYTNLVPGPYRFEVQASNSDGLWNGPIAKLAVYLEPAPWQTSWFRSAVVLTICAIGFAVFRLRMRAAKRQWNVRFQERLDERTRIARDLHDTLLQSFHGLLLRFQAARDMLPDEPEAAGQALDFAIDRAAAAITEGRDAVQALRGDDEDDELGNSLATIDREFRTEIRDPQQSPSEPGYRVLIEGTPRRLHPVVRDDLYRIAREAVRNAFRHADAQQIELDIRYDEGVFRLRVRDDGSGVDPQILSSGQRKGHYGLPSMRERAVNIGGQFDIWSELRRGTEIEVTIPGAIAYVRFEDT
jgi:signal transduction histidine kinase/ligand-binding sensor domain-containing protein